MKRKGIWNIANQGVYEFGDMMKTVVRKVSPYRIVYSEKKKRGPMLIPEGKAMTKKNAYRLVRYYCNRKGLFYSAGDMSELVDMLYEKKSKVEQVAERKREIYSGKYNPDLWEAYGQAA